MPTAQLLQRVYRLFNLAKISLGILLLTLISQRVNAQTAAVFKDSTGAIFLYGLQPNSSVEVGIVGNLVKAIRVAIPSGIASNECGLLIIRTDSAFSVDGQIINPATVTDVRTLTSNCNAANYPTVFKTPDGALALRKSSGAVYALAFPNHKTTRQVSTNACGYAVLRNITAASLNLPTVTGGRGDFAASSLAQAKPLACVKGNLYFPVGFNPKSAIALGGSKPFGQASPTTIASASTNPTIPTNPTTPTTPTAPTTAQNAQPTAAKNGSKLIISSIPPGTYTVANAANLGLKKTYTITSKTCLISDRTHLGNAASFLVSRQGLTFPISWGMLPEILAATVPSC